MKPEREGGFIGAGRNRLAAGLESLQDGALALISPQPGLGDEFLYRSAQRLWLAAREATLLFGYPEYFLYPGCKWVAKERFGVVREGVSERSGAVPPTVRGTGAVGIFF